MTTMSRRTLMGGLGVAAVAGSGALTPGPSYADRSRRHGRRGRRRRPSFLLVVVDDLGWGEIGANGQQVLQTPVLDGIARDGLVFDQAYATPTCAPTRCSLYTGKHTGHARVRSNADAATGLLPEDLTLAEVLRAEGYRTGLSGKWGLGPEVAGNPSHPNSKGYDHFFGYINQRHAHDYWPTYLWRDGERVAYPENEGADVTYAGTLITDDALGFLDGVGDDPFFLTVGYTTPHAPNEHPAELVAGGPYAGRPWPEGEINHAAQVTWTDEQVGILLARLAELGRDDDTIVVVLSDNGPHKEGATYGHVGSNLPHDPEFFDSGGPLRGTKRDLYEGGVRVPMVALVPGGPRGVRVEEPVAVWDFLPTFAELAGAPVPDGLDGVSFAPTCRGGRHRGGADRLYWQFSEGGFDEAVRLGPGLDWKAVRNEGAATELYHLPSDIGETADLATAHPALVAEAEALMAAARA